jgi:four helix bundle protein
MGYKRFEELPVWQASIELALATYAMTAQPPFRRQRSLRDQLERAALSVSNNIAEGLDGARIKSCSPFCISLAARRARCAPCFV